MFAVDFLIKFLVKCLEGNLIGLLPLLALIIYLKNQLLIATNLLFVLYSFLFLLLLDFESPAGSNLCIKYSQFNVHKVIFGQSKLFIPSCFGVFNLAHSLHSNSVLQELRMYNPEYLERPYIVVLNKIDLPEVCSFLLLPSI